MIPRQFGRVLVVDDNEDLAYLFSELLEMMGYGTYAAFSAKAALNVMPTYLPHVIFSDISMPEMSGYDFARTIRGSNLTQPLLISVSAWHDEKTILASREAGFEFHFGKPVSPEQICILLSNYFKSIGIDKQPFKYDI